MTAACIGTFVLAESGLLDDQRATTTWWLAPLFRQRYPSVLLDESNMIVRSGRFVTAGAALSHMDLALWLARGVSPQLASLTAKYLIVDSRPSQAAYSLVDHLVHSDAIVQRFETWARARLTRGFVRTLVGETEPAFSRASLGHARPLRVGLRHQRTGVRRPACGQGGRGPARPRLGGRPPDRQRSVRGGRAPDRLR
jgi:hypothetical protein